MATQPQQKLIDAAVKNGGTVTVAAPGEKVAARALMRKGIFKLTGVGVYSLAAA